MGRRRRSRKGNGIAIIPREKDGNLDRRYIKEELPDEASPAQIKRLRDNALAGMRDPEWGTELGRLFLERKITAEQFEAGRRYDRATQLYHRAMGAAALQIRPSDILVRQSGRGRGRSDADPESEEGQSQAKKHVADRIKWAMAKEALDSCGSMPARVVHEVVVEDMLLVGLANLAALKRGLDALVVAYGLTGESRKTKGDN